MVEYKEVIGKGGKRIVFCNLKDLLIEAYGTEDFEQYAINNEYIIHCPFCREEGHTKHKLYIKSDLSVGNCFVCGRAYVHVTNEFVPPKVELDDWEGFGFKEPFSVVPLTDPTWTLEKYKYDYDDYDESGISYLMSRHPYMKDLWKGLGFKFYDGNIIMPFLYHGEVFYYQMRFSNANSKSSIRYFFPPISNKPPYIIDHGKDIKKFIIVEGIFDAIACLIMAPSYIPIAVLGSSISDYQIDFIREYVPEKILIYMDETKISIRIAEKLKTAINYCPISIIKSDGEDPEEAMKRKMKRNPGSEINCIC